MKHVTREDVEIAAEEAATAKTAYDSAASVEKEKRAEMDASRVGGPISRRKEDPSVVAWIAAVNDRDARDAELTTARRVVSAMRRQYLVYLAREVSQAVIDKCGSLDGKPCRYKRVKSAVSQACEGIEGASVSLYDRGDLVVSCSDTPYEKGITLYPSGYDVASGEELFHAAYLEKYLESSDGIDGMLSHVLDADEVRKMVADLDGKLSDVCEKLRSAHDEARKLETYYRVIGLGDVVENTTKRAAI